MLAIDLGEKRIGLAVSDPTQTVAHGIDPIQRSSPQKSVIRAIIDIAEKYGGVEEMVVGLPKNLKGEIAKKALEVMSFVEDLRTAAGVPVKTWDERFSTVAAMRDLKEGAVARKKIKKLIDSSAAAFFLQGYLDLKKRRDNK